MSTLYSPEYTTFYERIVGTSQSSIHYYIKWINGFSWVVSGIAMVKGKNWGRYLFSGWFIINSFIFEYIYSPFELTVMVVDILVLGVLLYFLFRSRADQYFQN